MDREMGQGIERRRPGRCEPQHQLQPPDRKWLGAEMMDGRWKTETDERMR